MRYSILFVGTIFLLHSCVNYATVRSVKNNEEKIALQDYYSPCCGSCGQRIVIDKKNGEYNALQVNCILDDDYSTRCTPYQIGTQKQIMRYKKKKIISISFYRPVYDTIELKKIYPNLKKENYFDTALISKPILPLTNLDSMLIEKYFEMTTKKSCNDNYIKLIKGFIFVTDGNMKLHKEQKINFKSKSKSNGS